MSDERIPLSAVALMICGMSLIPMGDTAGKLLTSAHSVAPAFVAWSRFVIGAILAMIVLRMIPRIDLLMDWRIWLRGALIAAGILCILTSLRTEQLANAFGAFFIGPVVSYALSIWLIGEQLQKTRGFLVILGFLGVLCIVQPSSDMSFGILFAVLAGCFYGAFLTASRWLSAVAPAKDLLLTQLIVGSILLLPFGAANFPAVSTPVLGLISASAACSAAGNFLLIIAYAKAAATKLAPLVYTQLIAATALGLVVFNEIPNVLALTGLGVLLASGFGAMILRR